MALLGVFTATVAQKEVTVEGEYTYYIPSYQSKDEALVIAFDRARNAALIAEFNQTLFQSNTTIVSNRNGKSAVDYYSFSSSDVRGEWLGYDKRNGKDTTFAYDSNMKEFVIIAKVKGKAREIKSAGIEIDARVLRNRWEEQFEGYDFISGDSLYLYFRTPVDGYVTVWLLDYTSRTVYCLLPHTKSPFGAVQVHHEKEYVFFHQDDYFKNQKYTLTADAAVDMQEIFVVFSPNTYSKAICKTKSKSALPELSDKDFDSWLNNCRGKDKDMTVVRKLIKIKQQ